MTLQQLEYIVALDTYRHFVTAADKCFVTQPTLTMQVKKLEDEIGTIIFNRKKSPLEPTKAGEKIILKARQILREVNQLKELIQTEKEGLTGEFRLGIIPTLAPYLLPRFIFDFTNAHPETRLVIEEEQTSVIIHKLKNDLLDLGIVVTPVDEPAIREIPIFKEPFLLYVSPNHPLFRKTRVQPEDVKAEDIWLLNQGHCFRDQALQICGKSDRTDNRRGFWYESGSIETLKKMVEQNEGYTLVPELSVSMDAENPMVKRFTEPEPVREVSIVVHQSFSKDLLIDKLRDCILTKLPGRMTGQTSATRIKWR
jgi:LysR family transcriptional regulator, hydrogen peroxide-inducible genes activator